MQDLDIHHAQETCIIYTRVSDKEQVKGNSLDDQRTMCEVYARDHNMVVVEVFSDDGISGTSIDGRPGIKRALLRIQEGAPKIHHFLVKDTDRLARNAWDHAMMRGFLRKFGCHLTPLSRPNLDYEDPANNLMDGVMANVNEFYSRLYGQKTRQAMLAKAMRGEKPWPAPIGYKNINVGTFERSHNIIQVHPELSEFVREAFELFATGHYTCAQLLDIMFQRGMKTRRGERPSKSSFIHMLKNPFYFGKILHQGNLYDGSHEPIITESLFQRCQEVLGAHNHSADRRRKHTARFYLTRFLRCGICKGKCTAEIHGENLAYYHCSQTKSKHSNAGQNTQEADLEIQIAQEFRKIQVSKPFIEKMVARARTMLWEAHEKFDKRKRVIRQKINELECQRGNLEEDRLSRIVDADTFQRQSKRIAESLSALQKEEKELSSAREEKVDILNLFVALTDNLYETFMNAEPDLKEKLVWLFFEKFTLRDKKIVEVEYTKLLQHILSTGEVIITDWWLPNLNDFRTIIHANITSMTTWAKYEYVKFQFSL